jgi:hypothetical protein
MFNKRYNMRFESLVCAHDYRVRTDAPETLKLGKISEACNQRLLYQSRTPQYAGLKLPPMKVVRCANIDCVQTGKPQHII